MFVMSLINPSGYDITTTLALTSSLGSCVYWRGPQFHWRLFSDNKICVCVCVQGCVRVCVCKDIWLAMGFVYCIEQWNGWYPHIPDGEFGVNFTMCRLLVLFNLTLVHTIPLVSVSWVYVLKWMAGSLVSLSLDKVYFLDERMSLLSYHITRPLLWWSLF